MEQILYVKRRSIILIKQVLLAAKKGHQFNLMSFFKLRFLIRNMKSTFCYWKIWRCTCNRTCLKIKSSRYFFSSSIMAGNGYFTRCFIDVTINSILSCRIRLCYKTTKIIFQTVPQPLCTRGSPPQCTFSLCLMSKCHLFMNFNDFQLCWSFDQIRIKPSSPSDD